jgi:hypothetical protein
VRRVLKNSVASIGCLRGEEENSRSYRRNVGEVRPQNSLPTDQFPGCRLCEPFYELSDRPVLGSLRWTLVERVERRGVTRAALIVANLGFDLRRLDVGAWTDEFQSMEEGGIGNNRSDIRAA